jgi:hypothetical protein
MGIVCARFPFRIEAVCPLQFGSKDKQEYGRVAERSMAAVLKTVERKFRGFESYLFRQ